MLPVLQIFSVPIPTYFLVISLLCTIGVFVLPWWAVRFDQSEGTASRLYLIILVSGLLGARLFHVLFEEADFYIANPFQALLLWEGGYVFLGGVLFALVASWFWLKKTGEDFFIWGDFFAPFMAFGYAFGRLGCFFNGCCYGTECHLPWAVKFPAHMNVIYPFVPRHPTQIYAFLSELVLAVVLFILVFRKGKSIKAFKDSGLIFCTWIFFHGLNRFVLEFYRGDDRGDLYFGWSLSSLISIGLMSLGFWGFIWRRQKAKKL